MKILQLANDYIDRAIYKNLFEKLEANNITNIIYVPINKKNKLRGQKNVIIDPCFTDFDRIVFFSKQKKIIHAIDTILKTEEVDMLHAHTLFSSGFAAYSIFKKTGIPYIVAIRNTDVNVFFKYMLHLRRTGVEIMKNASAIVFLSNSYKNYVIDRYVDENEKNGILEKCIVIPNGIDDFFLSNIYNSKSKHSPIRLAFVGRIDKNKNVISIIEAMNILERRGIRTELHMMGDMIDKEVKHIIQGKENIRHYSHSSKVQVLQLLRNMDIYVMPSITETFGLTYVEAMSQGVPIIYSKGQGFDGQFRDGYVGYRVESRNAADIADKIQLIISDYDRISANCLCSCKRFSWSDISKQYENLYLSIIAKDK